MAIYAKRINGKQRAWLLNYEQATTFEPMHQDELDQGKMSFNEIARLNISWFESWKDDVFNSISSRVPWTWRKGSDYV